MHVTRIRNRRGHEEAWRSQGCGELLNYMSGTFKLSLKVSLSTTPSVGRPDGYPSGASNLLNCNYIIYLVLYFLSYRVVGSTARREP